MRRSGKPWRRRALLSARRNPDRGRVCRRTATVEWENPLMRAMEVEAAQLSVQRCTADAERLGGGQNVAVAARQRPLYGGPLGLVEIPRRAGHAAEQVGCRQRLLQKIPRHAERQPRRPRRADNEVVGIDRDQPTAAAIVSGANRKRAFGNASRKFSISIRRAASPTATAMRLTKPSVRSARQEDTSSAAASLPS